MSPEYRGVVLDDTGTAISGADVNLYGVDTTTPSVASTTTDSSGLWTISHATRGRFDVKITNGADVVWLRARDRVQFTTLDLNENAADEEALIVTRSEDAASLEVAIFEGDRATESDNDEAYISLKLANDADTQKEMIRLTWVATDVSDTTEDGRLDIGVMTAGTLADELSLDGTHLFPSTSDGLGLGDGTNMWADLFLASASVINFNNGDVTITHGANTLTFAAATSGYAFNNGNVYIGDSANANMTLGLTINQGAADDQLFAGKSSDVSHAMTSIAEADTFVEIVKSEATSGGATIRGYKDADGTAAAALVLNGRLGEAADTTSSTSGRAVVEVNAQVTDGGNNVTGVAAAGNAFGVRISGTMGLIVKGNNDVHHYGYIVPLITDTDAAVEGAIWYDASENKLKFYNGATVETITSA